MNMSHLNNKIYPLELNNILKKAPFDYKLLTPNDLKPKTSLFTLFIDGGTYLLR